MFKVLFLYIQDTNQESYLEGLQPSVISLGTVQYCISGAVLKNSANSSFGTYAAAICCREMNSNFVGCQLDYVYSILQQ